MRVSFIIPLELGAVGCRLLSSYLRKNGHETRLIFIPKIMPPIQEDTSHSPQKNAFCSSRFKEMVLDLVKGSDLVGFHVLTLFFDPIAELSQYIRDNSTIPVIWGGVHPTLAPKTCLPYADFVGLGDGEELLLELLEQLESTRDFSSIKGLAYLENGHEVKTESRMVHMNLDDYPYPDYSFQDHFLIQLEDGQEKLIEVTPENYGSFQKYYPSLEKGGKLIPYKTVSTRGCPFVCTYCSMGSMDQQSYPFRTRSPNNIIDELVEVLDTFGDKIGVISISDDTFLSHKKEWIMMFAQQYKARIDKPFRILGFPMNVRRDVIESLVDAGCMHIGVGVESLSERILFDIYRRKTKPDKVIEMANILVDVSKEKGVLPPTFDLIYANPYETKEDVITSIRGFTKIHPGFKVVVFNMNFFPNTELYYRAIQDGILNPDDRTSYQKWLGETDKEYSFVPILYETIWRGEASARFIHFLTNKPVFDFLNTLTNTFPTFHKFMAHRLPELSRSISKGYLLWYLLQRLLQLFTFGRLGT